jgi:hypothetical protein
MMASHQSGSAVAFWPRAFEVASDVLIATALLWLPALLLGGAAALVRLFVNVP